MSLALDFSSWVGNTTSWLGIINDSTHGALDILVGFIIAGAAALVLYSYLHGK